MLIIAYIATLMSYLCYCRSRYCKTKKNMVSLDLASKLFSIVALVLMGSLTGGFNMALSFVLLIIIRIREKRNFSEIANVLLFSVFLCGYIGILIFTFQGLPSVLTFLTSSLTLTGLCFLSPQGMRKIGIFASSLYLCYMLSIKNWVGLLEILVLFSNITSYLYYKKRGTS